MILSPVTVLVVEDEEMLGDLMVEELNELGFTVLKADTAEKALELIRGDKPIDVLFTDIRLPGRLDGWDLAERFREVYKRGPVIYTTGYSSDELRLVAGARFLKKPYRPAAVLEAVENFGIDGLL